MKYSFAAAALLAATASAQCTNDGGNYYCNLVDAITYTDVGGSGSYNRVTSMDSGSNTCGSSPQGYSGSISPLDEEVSWHFRGPLILSQFAAYAPGASSSKKSRRSEHVHKHARRHGHKAEKRQEVTATINGVAVSWANDYNETPAPVPSASPDDSSDTPSQASPTASYAAAASSAPSGSWGQTGYYSADAGTSNGIVFLNHNGGSGSGVFDYSFGNSLSYSSTDGTEGASSPQTLSSTTLPSSAEVVIMTDTECGANDGSCGYYRDGTVAYHGFDGANKAFFFEFQMPDSGETAASIYDPVNMPAIWMLNAQIPRTLQYGNVECSCWTSGCGEFDMFEVLAPGDTRAKSTLHGNKAGGDSSYFQRPEGAPIQVALVMSENSIHIQVLNTTGDFASSLDQSTIDGIISSTNAQSSSVSMFSLANAGSG